MSWPPGRAASVLTSLIAVSACTGGPTPTAGPGPSVPAGAPVPGRVHQPLPALPAAGGPEAAAAGAVRAPAYSPRGHRDPFEIGAVPPRSAGEAPRPAVSAARLAGIVRGAGGDLALLETPDGAGHVLRAGDQFQGLRLIAIGADSVIMEVARGASSERIVLRMEASR